MKKMSTRSIDPNKLYLYKGWAKNVDVPCRVVCTDDPGWKRGYVKIETINSSFYASLLPIIGDQFYANVIPNGENFVFSSPLIELPDNFLEEMQETLKSKIDSLTRKLKCVEAEIELKEKL